MRRLCLHGQRCPKQRKVVLHRILWTELAEAFREGDDSFLVVCLAVQKADKAGGTAHVEIKRDEERSRGNAFPEAHVHGDFAPHEPAQGEVEALAGGIGGGVCYVLGVEAAVAAGHRFPEKADAFPDIARRREEGPKASVFRITGPEAPAEITQITFKKSAVDGAIF